MRGLSGPVQSERRSRIEREMSMTSRASSGVMVPTVIMSQSRMVAHENASPTSGSSCPAARGLMVMTGFFAFQMMR